MENQDIYTFISQNLNDTKSLLSACHVNMTMKKVCSTKYFWEPIFIKNNLPLPLTIYTETSEWLHEYNKTHDTMMMTHHFINMIPHELHLSKLTTFNINFYNLLNDLDIKPYYELQYLQDLAADGLEPNDLEDIFRYVDGDLIRKISVSYHDGLNIITVWFYGEDDVDFYANQEQLEHFLFHLFYNHHVTRLNNY